MRRMLSFVLATFLCLVSGAETRALDTPAQTPVIELVMFEANGCVYCARWHAEVGPGWPNSSEGKFAPLRPVFRHEPLPADLTFDGRLTFTPTFVLMRDGQEIARLEGYPGADFFWALMAQMLRDHTDYAEVTQ